MIKRQTFPKGLRWYGRATRMGVLDLLKTFDACHDRALASQVEAPVVARAIDSILVVRSHFEIFPLFRELLAVRREVLARRVLRVPFDGVDQHDTPGLLALEQLEGAAPPVRSQIRGALLA